MKYTPIGEKVLIRCDPEADQTNGGLVIPQSARHAAKSGVVVAVGPRTDTLEKGDHIAYEWGTGVELAFGGIPHVELLEDQVLGVWPA